MSKDTIEKTILGLVEARGPQKSVCPSEVAREVWPKTWRDHMRDVRTSAIGLARKGEISILRKGRPVDPENFKGVYRLSLPRGAGDDG